MKDVKPYRECGCPCQAHVVHLSSFERCGPDWSLVGPVTAPPSKQRLPSSNEASSANSSRCVLGNADGERCSCSFEVVSFEHQDRERQVTRRRLATKPGLQPQTKEGVVQQDLETNVVGRLPGSCLRAPWQSFRFPVGRLAAARIPEMAVAAHV
jgi:hypothetical protein